MVTSICTGAAGFLGSHVAEHLVRMGHKVIVIDDLSGGCVENIPLGTTFYKRSILDWREIDRIFQEHQPDLVFHLGAYAAENLSPHIKRFNYENNLVGSCAIINAAVNYGCKGIIFTSSAAVYGSAPTPFVETQTPQPEDSYGIAKWAVEQELRITDKLFGLPYILFRPHNVFGPRQNTGDKFRNVIAIFMNQCLKNEPLTIFGDGMQRRAFSYIDDVAPLIAESITIPAAWRQTMNIGADTPYTINELAEAVSRAMGVPLNVKHLDERHEVQEAFSDHSLLRRVFGDRPTVPLEEGLTRMAAWVQQHGARETKPFTEIEIRKQLPPSWA